MARPYVPDRGDLVWARFDPQAGHEQAGIRPAVILSPREYNNASGLALLCPVTSRIKGYPYEVPLPTGGPMAGVILSDQLKSLDWRARQVRYAGRAQGPVMAEVMAKVKTLLG
jgi:mRNA interferase MazF